jgi:hypothetical protein
MFGLGIESIVTLLLAGAAGYYIGRHYLLTGGKAA